MTYVLVPGETSRDDAELWIGAVGEKDTVARARLEVDGQARALGPWESLTTSDGELLLQHQRLRVGRPSTASGAAGRARAQLVVDELRKPDETATLRFLPDRLPSDGRPFSVLLASCFATTDDHGGDVSRTYLAMPQERRPDAKLLCGDQVYLDVHSRRPKSGAGLDPFLRAFNDTYLKSWRGSNSLQSLLTDGPNWFVADDHELWNNYPFLGVLFPFSTWLSKARRQSWEAAARLMYQTYQTSKTTAQFEVAGAPGLSFFVADMRLGRTVDRQRFMSDGDLQRLGAWIDGLTGPGIIVAGSPLFYAPTGSILGAVNNWELSNFGQYATLVAHLKRSQHSLLFLTGDVHWGRIAACTLPSGKQLIEIISSPLALSSELSQKVFKRWKKAPALLPPGDEKTGLAIKTLPENAPYKITDNHFVTLEFNQVADGVSLKVCPWIIGRSPQQNGRVAFNVTLS